MAVSPWLSFWFFGANWVFDVSCMLYAAAVVGLGLTQILAMRCLSGGRPISEAFGWTGVLAAAVVATTILPISLSTYLFTDQGIAFRRVVFGSIVFQVVVLSTIFLLLYAWRSNVAKFASWAFSLAVPCLLIAVGWLIDVAVVQVAGREWAAARCAARQVMLTDPASINRKVALALPAQPFPHAATGDEFQVRTLSFIPSGALMLWLSQDENGKTPAFSPWTLQFREDDVLNEWDQAFARCSASRPPRALPPWVSP